MSHLVRLLASQPRFPRLIVVAMAAVSGISSVLVLLIVNLAARELSLSAMSWVDGWLAALFAVGIALYAASETWMISKVCSQLEDAIHRLRTRLVRSVILADFEKVEAVGRSALFEGITQATQTIAQNSQFLALGLRSAVMVVAILAYIAVISPTAFVLIAFATTICGLFYHQAGQRLMAGFSKMMDVDRGMFESLGDSLDGFQEIRLSSARRRDLGAEFASVSAAVTAVRADVQIRAMQQFVLGQMAIYFLLAVVVFVVPLYSPAFRGEVVEVTTSVLFMTGAIGALIQAVPLLGASEQAALRMFQLQDLLAAIAEPATPVAPPVPAAFLSVGLRAVSYRYPPVDGEAGFALGPVDFTVNAGEIVFITGGNGSGKSTLIKLLTGLIHPATGTLAIDGISVAAEEFRSLLSPVFADCHVFPTLWGTAPFEDAEADRLIGWMELDGIVRIRDRRFDRTALSAGQRKRLALITALLERRPVLVLDEWAADQSPQFRRKFYRQILPALKAEGKTVIAVTHDDAYFDAADRRFHVEEGRLSEIAAGEG